MNYKITKISVEARRSYNYNSFGCEVSAEIYSEDDKTIQNAKDYLWTIANTECNMQINQLKEQERKEKQSKVKQQQSGNVVDLGI